MKQSTTSLKALQLTSILFTAIAMAAGWAHLLELPNKMQLSREEYLIVQQIYRGWALLGFVVIGALILSGLLAWLERGEGPSFYFALTGTACTALTLVIFFSFTYPANQVTQNWTMLPEEWEPLRRRWEYSHAASAILYFMTLAMLFSLLLRDGADGIWARPIVNGKDSSLKSERTGTFP